MSLALNSAVRAFSPIPSRPTFSSPSRELLLSCLSFTKGAGEREGEERKRSYGRHAHAATTFRVQKLCLWAEKIYRLHADIHIAARCALSAWNLGSKCWRGKFILRIQFAAPLFSEIKGVAEHDIRLWEII